MAKSIAKFSPSRMIIGSLLLAITLGTALLSLPIVQKKAVAFIDCLFLATSSMCVCGLTPITLDHFNDYGIGIILLLMQIGGLSLVTLSLFLLTMFIKRFGLRTQLMANQLLELDSWKDFKTILFFTICLTLISELIGTGLIYLSIAPYYSIKKGLWVALFQSVSSFCSCGFSIMAEPLHIMHNNYLFLLSSAALMLIGGFGFLAWHDIYSYFTNPEHKKHSHLNLHTHLVLITTALISITGITIYWILEHNNSLAEQGVLSSVVNSLFNITGARSTGLSTSLIPELQVATLLLLMCIAFIGSSPNSTGSGIKTITFALMVAMIKAGLTGKNDVTLRGRTIPRDQISKAAIIFTLNLCLLLCAIFLMLITEKSHSFLSVVFEVVNSYTNVGIHSGLTHSLTISGKIISMFSMLIGRIGALGFLLAFQRPVEVQEFSYPEERVMLN